MPGLLLAEREVNGNLTSKLVIPHVEKWAFVQIGEKVCLTDG